MPAGVSAGRYWVSGRDILPLTGEGVWAGIMVKRRGGTDLELKRLMGVIEEECEVRVEGNDGVGRLISYWGVGYSTGDRVLRSMMAEGVPRGLLSSKLAGLLPLLCPPLPGLVRYGTSFCLRLEGEVMGRK